VDGHHSVFISVSSSKGGASGSLTCECHRKGTRHASFVELVYHAPDARDSPTDEIIKDYPHLAIKNRDWSLT